MRRKTVALIGLVLTLLVGTVAAQRSHGPDGAFLSLSDYKVVGQWLYKRSSVPVCFEGATDDAFYTCLDVVDPTATRTWTLPDASDTAVGKATTDTLTNKTITAPVLSGSVTGTYTLAGTPSVTNPAVTGDASSGLVVSKTCAFVEDATMTTSTCTIVIPAGATIVDVVATSSVLWTKASARLIVGDTQSANGWFVSTNLNATDLLVGEALRAAGGTAAWGGLQGAYLVSATGVFGQATSTKSGPYYTTAGNVIGVVTVTPGAGTAGRTFLTVTYSVGQTVAPVVA